jgi:serine carboxypeptidase 1
MKCIIILVAVAAAVVMATNDNKAAYGYVEVNKEYNSNMFYALQYAKNDSSTRPLVIYLQGGPGATSLFGDFLENGPQKLLVNMSVVEREHTWTNHANMLYIDNPVGTGFSYTKDPRGFSTTDQGVADNLITFILSWQNTFSEFQNRDLWVFCESYGGKMTAFFGAALTKAKIEGKLKLNFKGVALGDGWVDPVGCMYSYGPYLQSHALITGDQVEVSNNYARKARDALDNANGTQSTYYWGVQQGWLTTFTAGINWYNVNYFYDYTADVVLNRFLRTTFAKMLGSIVPAGVQYNAQSNEVFEKMSNAFMGDGISQVDYMLRNNITVNVYNGQVDLIVDVLCTEGWLKKLSWSGMQGFWGASRAPALTDSDGNVKLFKQKYDNFAFWQVMGAGHMVPLDQPASAEFMMAAIIGGDTSRVSRATEPTTARHEKVSDTKDRLLFKP